MKELDVNLIVKTAKSIYNYSGPAVEVWGLIEKHEDQGKLTARELNTLLEFIYRHRQAGMKPKSIAQIKHEIFEKIGVECSSGSTLSKDDLIEIHKYIVLSG